MSYVLAFDLGASSGRAILGHIANGKIELEELHRFPNDPVKIGNRLYWDILRLFHEVKQGLLKAKHRGVKIDSLAIDSWGVDFGLLDEQGQLLANPFHYRDAENNAVYEEILVQLGADQIFQHTGIQLMSINTLFQFAAMKKANSPALKNAKHMLMIPGLLRYFLTGNMHNEFTLSTTSQIYNATTKDWDSELLSQIGVDAEIFVKAVQPGTNVGMLREDICQELGIDSIPVIAVGEHDTASAVAAVPAFNKDFVYLSCGTWSLFGTEVEAPIVNAEAQQLHFTNEGGVFNTYRLLSNIMGLWIIQESKREWERQGNSYSFSELVKLASEAEPFVSYIDVDDELFLGAGNMLKQIDAYCAKTGQAKPTTVGSYARTIYEGLALKYRHTLETIERLTDRTYDGLHMVGGGIQNQLLCQWTADALRRPVWAGPIEGSAIGNMLVQWIASGEIKDIWEARKLVEQSFPVITYESQSDIDWEAAYMKYKQVTTLQ